MQSHWESLCVVGQEKNQTDKNKDMVLQVEQWMLSARHAAGIAVVHSKRRDGKKPNLKCFRGIPGLL